jgi:predicted ATPase
VTTPLNHLLSLGLKNFKALQDVQIELKPLTLFVGQNSVGKSTTFQAVLTVANWLRVGAPLNEYFLNSANVRLGGFGDVVTHGQIAALLSIAVEDSNLKLELDISSGSENAAGPVIQNFEISGKKFGAGLVRSRPQGKYFFNIQAQKVETSWTNEVGMDIEGEYTFGSLSYEVDIDFGKPQPDLNQLGILDSLSLPYLLGDRFNLGLEVARELTYFAAIEANLRGGHIAIPNGVEYVDLGEYLKELLTNHLHGTGSIIKRYREDVAKNGKSSYSDYDLLSSLSMLISRRVQDLGLGADSLFDSDLRSPGYRLAFMGNPKPHIIPKLHGVYETPLQYSEPPQQLEPEDIRIVLQTLLGFGLGEKPKQQTSIESLTLEEMLPLFDAELPNVKGLIRDFVEARRIRWFASTGDYWTDAEIKTPLDVSKEAIVDFSNTLTKHLFYLGPLRVDGFSRVNLGTVVPEDAPVGNSGEFTSLLLMDELKSTQLREYPLFDHASGKWAVKTCSFQDSLSSWFQLFTVPNATLSVKDYGKFGVQVEMGGRTLDQFGTGASQVLPILALLLSRDPGDIVLLEQPELHLHPGGQQYLADFLMSSISRGVQVILETHSEYMVNRIRRGIVLGSVDSQDVKIVNFEQTENGLTDVHNVSMSSSGGFLDWPKGFFAQTEDDLLAIIEALEDF